MRISYDVQSLASQIDPTPGCQPLKRWQCANRDRSNMAQTRLQATACTTPVRSHKRRLCLKIGQC